MCSNKPWRTLSVGKGLRLSPVDEEESLRSSTQADDLARLAFWIHHTSVRVKNECERMRLEQV